MCVIKKNTSDWKLNGVHHFWLGVYLTLVYARVGDSHSRQAQSPRVTAGHVLDAKSRVAAERVLSGGEDSQLASFHPRHLMRRWRWLYIWNKKKDTVFNIHHIMEIELYVNILLATYAAYQVRTQFLSLSTRTPNNNYSKFLRSSS